MKSIVVTYPYFQSLPKGIKKMLVASESLFFGDVRSTPMERPMGAGLPHAMRDESEESIARTRLSPKWT
jgi:hypothetical protein